MLIYGSATMGATIHLHYCMDELVGWSLHHDEDEKCGKCGMDEKDNGGCCKDEHKHFKLKVDHQKAGVPTMLAVALAPAIVNPLPDFNFQPYIKATESYSLCHAPPDIGETNLHVLHCLFLI